MNSSKHIFIVGSSATNFNCTSLPNCPLPNALLDPRDLQCICFIERFFCNAPKACTRVHGFKFPNRLGSDSDPSDASLGS